MTREYPKGARLPIGKKGLFTTQDFDCHCSRKECAVTLVSDVLVEGLELYWQLVGPFAIDSGFRCHAHNAEIGGASESQHPRGTASDCKSKQGLPGKTMAQKAESITVFYNGGIGTYPNFAHVDVRGKRARWGLGSPC